ncbi:hypothetical protein N803_16645 [Knoellia subterranea KCTC 19937]|uniref:Uncharacterized protein n=1 Tax=Knoellia subterranea KCTC 19937 TaxID=1385521 RepID=A0A0A0JI55_9MICO|nr:hypothetical protein N803_16645 [Knoellia subterranea KCTC 19937]
MPARAPRPIWRYSTEVLSRVIEAGPADRGEVALT